MTNDWIKTPEGRDLGAGHHRAAGVAVTTKRTPPGRDVPPLYAGIAANAARSRAAAVKLFCLECVGYVRKDVTECTAHACPLYNWRPYQAGDEDDEGALVPQICGANEPEATQADSKLPDSLPARKMPSRGHKGRFLP